jgi:hypothetical protein
MQDAYNARPEARAAREAYRLSEAGRANEAAWRASPEGRAVILANVAKRRALHRKRVVSLTREEKVQIETLHLEAARLTRETGEPHHVDQYCPLFAGRCFPCALSDRHCVAL